MDRGSDEDQLMMRYLLRELPEQDRAPLQEQFFTDEEFATRLRAVESDLIDAYARGEVSPDRRRRIEECLLSTPAQREKLAFARSLHQVLAEEQPRKAGRSWMLAVACLILGLLVGGIATSLLIKNRRIAPQPLAQSYAFLLSPGVRRDAAEVQRLSIPSTAETLRLDLELHPGDEGQKYSVTIADREGRAVWRQEPMDSRPRNSAFVVEVLLPRRALRSGAYVLSLSGPEGLIEQYAFAVTGP
jgi:hypothetical protein